MRHRSNRTLPSQFDVRSIPTLLVFRGQGPVGHIVGRGAAREIATDKKV